MTRELELRDRRGKCARKLFRISYMTPELELRGPQHNFAHDSEEISSLHPELVLRHIPRKSAQGRRQTQRFRALFLRAALLQPVRKEVIGVSRSPDRLHLPPMCGLTIGSSASTLTLSNSRIGTEPTMTN
jgi:hypothetical protein